MSDRRAFLLAIGVVLGGCLVTAVAKGERASTLRRAELTRSTASTYID